MQISQYLILLPEFLEDLIAMTAERDVRVAGLGYLSAMAVVSVLLRAKGMIIEIRQLFFYFVNGLLHLDFRSRQHACLHTTAYKFEINYLDFCYATILLTL